MRKFRFVGDPEEYGYTRGLYFGNIYPVDFRPYSNIGNTIEDIFTNEEGGKLSRHDWQEVTDGKPHIIDTTKPLHKDTDLGYYAGPAMQGQFSQIDKYIEQYDENWIDPFIQNSIILAKELIKQLNDASTDNLSPH